MKHINSLQTQKGVVLLLMMLVVLVSGSSMALSVMNNRTPILENQAELYTQLEIAKQSLLNYVARSHINSNSDAGPGHFPCPDYTHVGYVINTSGCNSKGLLPEYAVLPDGSKYVFNDFYAETGEQFWYTVSPYFIDSNSYDLYSGLYYEYLGPQYQWNLTTSVKSGLTVDYNAADYGAPDYDPIIAVIIAPGPELEGQNRSASSTNPNNYLDDSNSYMNFNTNGIWNFITNDGRSNASTFNDRIITITKSELMTKVTMEVARGVKQILDTELTLVDDPQSYPTGTYYNSADTVFDARINDSAYAPAWLKDYESGFWGGSANRAGENWLEDITYSYSGNIATISFSGCAISYSWIPAYPEIVRSSKEC